MWFSHKRTARSMSYVLGRSRKTLKVCSSSEKTLMMIVTWDALRDLTGSGDTVMHTAVAFNFHRSFRIENITTFKVQRVHIVLLINEQQNFIQPDFLKLSEQFDFRAQKRTVLSVWFWTVAEHSFMPSAKVFLFRQTLSIFFWKSINAKFQQ